MLALAMLFIVAASVEAAGWTEGLAVVQSAVLGGALVAFLLALTRWGSRVCDPLRPAGQYPLDSNRAGAHFRADR